MPSCKEDEKSIQTLLRMNEQLKCLKVSVRTVTTSCYQIKIYKTIFSCIEFFMSSCDFFVKFLVSFMYDIRFANIQKTCSPKVNIFFFWNTLKSFQQASTQVYFVILYNIIIKYHNNIKTLQLYNIILYKCYYKVAFFFAYVPVLWIFR